MGALYDPQGPSRGPAWPEWIGTGPIRAFRVSALLGSSWGELGPTNYEWPAENTRLFFVGAQFCPPLGRGPHKEKAS